MFFWHVSLRSLYLILKVPTATTTTNKPGHSTQSTASTDSLSTSTESTDSSSTSTASTDSSSTSTASTDSSSTSTESTDYSSTSTASTDSSSTSTESTDSTSVLPTEPPLDYRIPKNLNPVRYEVRLMPFIEVGDFSTSGSVVIEFEVEEPTSRIVLHMADIITYNDTISVSPYKNPLHWKIKLNSW